MPPGRTLVGGVAGDLGHHQDVLVEAAARLHEVHVDEAPVVGPAAVTITWSTVVGRSRKKRSRRRDPLASKAAVRLRPQLLRSLLQSARHSGR